MRQGDIGGLDPDARRGGAGSGGRGGRGAPAPGGAVVGNSAYQNVPARPNPEHDADKVAAALRAIGFDRCRSPTMPIIKR
jgi:hypothetical protein